jgi:hypothetical protein
LGVTGFLSIARIAKTNEKIFSNHDLDTTEIGSFEVSDGVGVDGV